MKLDESYMSKFLIYEYKKDYVFSIKLTDIIRKEIYNAEMVSKNDNDDIRENIGIFYKNITNFLRRIFSAVLLGDHNILELKDNLFFILRDNNNELTHANLYATKSKINDKVEIYIEIDDDPSNRILIDSDIQLSNYYIEYMNIESFIDSFICNMNNNGFSIIYDPFCKMDTFDFLLNISEDIAEIEYVNMYLKELMSYDYQNNGISKLDKVVLKSYYKNYILNGKLFQEQMQLLKLNDKYGN